MRTYKGWQLVFALLRHPTFRVSLVDDSGYPGPLRLLLQRGFISGYEISRLSTKNAACVRRYIRRFGWLLRNGDGWFRPSYWKDCK